MKAEKTKLTEGAVVVTPASTGANKTGSWRTYKPCLDQKKCIRCGICWNFCPDNCFMLKKETENKKYKHRFEINYDYCKGCGICAKECPVKAIMMQREEK
ncbi:MAG: 4Fe-4S binding protein [Candidatus Nanoarchaeia archaeon]|nr:4Fe-4S binding protein [Candidatus Nanoarchaeia archaeon]